MKLSRFPLSTLLDSASGHLEAHLLQKKESAPTEVTGSSPYSGIIFSGNPHETVPRRLLLDDRLTPLERNAWQVFRLLINDDGVTAFPTYDQLRPYLGMQPGKAASRETISKALVTLRLTRWLSLGRRVRNDLSGQVQGNVYLLHDEPVSPAEAIEFDKDYVQLLSQSMEHQNKAIREVAEIAWREFAADPDVGIRLPRRLDVIAERLSEQAWVKETQGNEATKTTEFGIRTQQNPTQSPLSSESELSDKLGIEPIFPLSSESEPSLKPQSSRSVRIPNSYSTYTDTHKDVCKSSVHVPPDPNVVATELLQALQRLPADQKQSAVEAMQKVPIEIKPALIRQWVHRCEGGSLRNPVGYLLTLVNKAVRGEFNSNWSPEDQAGTEAASSAPPALAVDQTLANPQIVLSAAKTPAPNAPRGAERPPETVAAAKHEISAMISQLRFGKPNTH
ncbi:STY4528 family pathogenicity island replication protein [Pseudomonas chlororaphis]|uniref:Helix-turn-helix domain-containing protein n=1 Tax=Pseudomonas chlororaphis TaxID=587753 RepID=A0AAX3FWM4_9PSED|nr:STY4528 family pathogenicity island replication protein [Pseudomonas chlororaphis]AZC39396.1 hypothetical protein C4K37_5031 [Pseudomonas chlororaphis subsp. piscium]AZC45947.1 hypothetical protein C4K36_5044 [Pseudomonas chlororaphis subsp. piscium]WDG71481.1 STY4528 family pathogenicity island replication protein [Pseudomonas chlororaphis]WDH30735.1 STY4528 family pathogenicity island replication protein [Pseudomonas chlororaphis]WDH70007.1 STY4528 family pathogenicity island replication 